MNKQILIICIIGLHNKMPALNHTLNNMLAYHTHYGIDEYQLGSKLFLYLYCGTHGYVIKAIDSAIFCLHYKLLIQIFFEEVLNFYKNKHYNAHLQVCAVCYSFFPGIPTTRKLLGCQCTKYYFYHFH